MRKLLTIIGLFVMLAGCKQDPVVVPVLEDLIAAYRQDDAIRLEVSSEQVKLDPAKRREQALLVTWEPLKDIEAHYPVRYLFKMDVTENNFKTSIPAIEIPNGVFYKTYSHEELENLIRTYWQRVETGNVSISVRVIAQVNSEHKVIMPLYSTLPISVTPYQIDASSLFVYGSATGGNNMLEMKEVVPGEIYTWRGTLNVGSFKIATVMDQSYPAYGQKANGDIILMESADDNDGSDFVVDREGDYAIILDRINNRIVIEEVPYLNIYFGGSGAPTGWNTPPLMEWDNFRPNICTITTFLTAATINGTSMTGGEIKFSTEPNFSSGTQQLRPIVADASILTDLHVQASSAPDRKWRIMPGQTGQYKIILDVKSMKVQFNKID